MDDHPSGKARRPWLPVLVTLVLLVVLGGWVGWQWWTLEQAARVEQTRRFESEVDYIEQRLRERMQAYEMVLRGLAGLTAVSDHASPDDWLKATDQLMLQETYPGIQAVNLARHAPRQELPGLVDFIRFYRPDFQVWPEPAGDQVLIVEYTHPTVWRNRQVLGFDLLSEPVRRQAVLRARDTGYATLSGPLRLIQETDERVQSGVLFFLPIYRGGQPISSPVERQEAFVGTLYGSFRMDDLMEGVLGERLELLEVQLFDAAEPGSPLLSSDMPYADARFRAERPIYLYGRNWLLQVAGTPGYERLLRHDSRLFGLVAGLAAVVLFSLLVGGYLFLRERALSSSRALTLQLRERESRVRLLIEKLPVATVLCDHEGRIELANRSAAGLLGCSVEELLGRRVGYFLPDMTGSEPPPPDQEVQLHRHDGGSVPVTLHVTRLSNEPLPHTVINLIDLRAFKRAEERFRDMVEGLPNGFLLVNRQGLIVMVNRQTERLLGYSRDELLGGPIEQLIPEALRAGHVGLRDAFLKDPEARRDSSTLEVFAQHRDGQHIPLEIGLAVLHSGEDLLVQAVLVDISHRKAAELRLRDQADQLALASRYKSEFLANMSHELRTPLNSILILSDQLRQNGTGTLSEKQTRHADIIYRAGKDLLQMINDVLDLSQIEAGRLRLKVETVELEPLLQALCEALQPQVDEKGLSLGYRFEPGVPATVATDRERLQQVLRNLLSNALKFTERGEIEMVIRLLPAGEGETVPWLQIQVRDTGIGIAEDQQERIFQAFQQIDGSINRRYGGTGLGLAITRQLVEVLNGRIRLQSRLGEGACFNVELPLELERQATPATPLDNRQRLLIVADPATTAPIEDVAQVHGLACWRCESASECRNHLSEQRFQAAVMDFDILADQGWPLYRALREDPRHHDMPVIVLSSQPQPPHWQDGALHLLGKPLTRENWQWLFGELLRGESHVNRLLLLEAEPERVRHLRERFERLGYSVTPSRSAEEVRMAFAAQDYRALVIDFDLPAGGGMSMLNALNRLRPLNRNVKVIVYSREPLPEAELKQLPAGVVVLPRLDSEERMDALLQQPGTLAGPEPVGRPLLGRKVLLFDADVRNVFLRCGQLDELGLQTTPATSVQEAVARFEEAAFDLVLLAMDPQGELPGLVHRLRSEHGCQVPILCLSATACEACRAAGADDCLEGSPEAFALGDFIQRWLGEAPTGETT